MRILIVVALLLVFSPRPNWSQVPLTPEQPWATRPVIQVWPGAAPGSEHDSRKEVMTVSPFTPSAHIVRNVSVPTLTVFQPRSGNSSGTAILICPGGGFRMLSIDLEGYQVADWFAQHGVTAFVLKYRVAETPARDADFLPPNASMQEIMKRATAPLPEGQVAISISDGVQALKVVRSSAAKYGFRADRVVALGFSAGGAVVIGAASAQILPTAQTMLRPSTERSCRRCRFRPATLLRSSLPWLTTTPSSPLWSYVSSRLFATKAQPPNCTHTAPEVTVSLCEPSEPATTGSRNLWWWMESFKLTTP